MQGREFRTLNPGDVMEFATRQARDLLRRGGKEDRLF
jgi:hypothetical protein